MGHHGVCRFLIASALAFGCGGDDSTVMHDASALDGAGLPSYREPILSSVTPPSVTVGSADLEIEVAGEFDADAVVMLDGVALTTRVISATELAADVPADLMSTARLRWLQVAHTEAGGGISGSKQFDVILGVAAPVLDELVPDRLIVGNAAATLRIDGWNFRSTSVVMWNGEARPTTFVGSTWLTAEIPATDFATVGTAEVTVVTPDAADAAAPLDFTIQPLPVQVIGVDELVSVTTAGLAGGGQGGAFSADGRYVAFESSATDIVAADGNAVADVFVRDTCRGASSCTPSTVRVSVDAAGGDADAASTLPAISATGRYVAFVSVATDLVAGAPSDGAYVRDTCIGASGCTPTTVLASLLPDDASVSSFGFINRVQISRDGRFVVFDGLANMAVTTVHVFLSDTCLGVATACTPRTELVSKTLSGTPATAAEFPAVSGDGRYVAFAAFGPGLDDLAAEPDRRHVYVLDTCLGDGACTRSITRATWLADGSEPTSSFPMGVAISDDGRHVGFSTYGAGWTAESNPTDQMQVYVRDTCLGATSCTPTTSNVSAVGGSASNDWGFSAAFSADTRFVAFTSKATDLVVNDTNNKYDVFVRDRCLGAAGCTPSLRRISVTPAGVEGDDDHGTGTDGSPKPCVWLSADGSLAAWTTKATNFSANDTNTVGDVYVAGTGYPQ